jgi:hypothetical protein
MADAVEQPTGPVASPCVGICCVGADGVCIGCFRSLDELAVWTTANDTEKRRILRNCRARQQRTPR